MLVKVGLEQQGSITVSLVCIISFLSVETASMMNRSTEDEGDVRHVLRVNDVGILGKGLIALVGDIYEVRICHRVMVCSLSTFTMFLQSFDDSLKDVGITHICPTAHQCSLPHLRHVGKAIAIIVVCFFEQFIMAK